MRRYFFLFFLLVSVTHFPCYSEGYYFQHFQTENGLSNNTVSAVIQDRKGFIWVGTKDGLNRFDGYNFKVFKLKTDSYLQLGNNSIWKVHEGRNQVLWVGTERGMYLFDPTTERFSFLKNTPAKQVRDIAEDNEGNIWMIIGFQLYQWNSRTLRVTRFTQQGLQSCSALTVSANNQLWIGNMSGDLANYDQEKGLFRFYSVFSHSKPAVSHWIERIYDTGKGYFLIGTSNQGIKKFNINERSYEDLLTYNNDKTEIFARDFVKTKANEFWIATESGIYIYNDENGQFTNIKKNYQNPYAISDNAIYSLCRDREGGIWIGSYFGGLNYYSNENPPFEKYFSGKDDHSIQGNAIREIVADNARHLWIGTEDAGLNRLDLQTGLFKNFRPDGTPSSIANTNIHGLLCDGDSLWIGTFEHGLDIMDLRSEKVIRHFNAGPGPYDLKSNFIHSIYKSTDRRIWLGTSNGIYIYNPGTSDFKELPFFPKNSFYACILEASDGTIWAGTFQDGLHYYNPRKHIAGRLQILQQHKDRLSQNRITFIHESSGKELWVATEDGLYKLDLPAKKLKIYTTETGFPSNLIYTITEDHLHRHWITTSKGLVLLDQQGNILRTFTKTSGLLGDQFNYSSLYRSKDGNIYYGSVKGMISFNPALLKADNYIPPLYITDFSVFNTPLPISPQNGPLKQSVLITRHITLPYNRSTFNIDFAALNFTAPDNVEYAYKLEGLDRDWNHIKTNRSVYFTNLPHGEYVFKVRSTNSSGRWQYNEQRIRITINPPAWKTPLAYFLYMLLLATAGFLVMKTYRRNQASKQQRKMQLYAVQKEKELIDAKIDFFTKVAHEIRTPLTLIKAPLEKITKLIRQTPQTEKYLRSMNRNTDRLLELSNQLLDFRKAESEQFSLNFVPVNIPELLTSIWLNFQPTAEERGVIFELSVPPEPFHAAIDPEAFTKIISNLLDNAIKYCKQKVITVLEKGDQTFSIRISNDGEPVPEKDRDRIFELFFRSRFTESISGAGIGLSLAKSLVDLHQGSIRLVSTGNLITFETLFPIRHPQL
ncbi:ligand-binding sensor domain-containing protein [Niabella drilacis]|uniref:histidine kinase n=1 Tax=Niabella drilacis (strain DSM 25811 / CCM 8410 / CCUG 62505 / LMG 26954 / E90) TaxID=1285928 RepID=A0A1G6TX20_NIADE|nr:two-component regulator propeller domain-containing protein [Niabella drilacis]SDD33658.1 Signal transduction histidine kinase [Niabella drilacis]